MRWLLIGLLALVAGCVTFSLDNLTPATKVYAMQREFNEIYLPPIVTYAEKDFCDAGASPPVVTNCADAKTVIALNTVAQEAGDALKVAQGAVRAVDTACAVPESPQCSDTTQILAASIEALRVVLARVSAEFVKAGLD